MNGLTEEYVKIIESVNGDEDGRRECRKNMEKSELYWGERLTDLSYVPVCLEYEKRQCFIDAAKMIYSIFSKVLEEYVKNPAFRKEFDFGKAAADMIEFPSEAKYLLPFMRADFLYDEKTGKMVFCELNTDASGGMAESIEYTKLIKSTKPYSVFSKKYDITTDENLMMNNLAESFRKMYDSYSGREKGARARVAIVICLDEPDTDVREIKLYMKYFEKVGFDVSIFDARQIEYDGKNVFGKKAMGGESNVKIDCIWRFCIISDLIKFADETAQFLKAAKDGAVLMLGSFLTQVVHDKQIFAVIKRQSVQYLFDEAQRRFIENCIPYTAFLSDTENVEEIKNNPQKWIIKPTDMYASIGVISGAECDCEKWGEIIDGYRKDGASSRRIIQEFSEPSVFSSIPLYGNESDYTNEPQPFGTLYGIYIYGGEYSGTYIRQGPEKVICDERRGVTAPLLWVKEKK